MSFSQSLPLSYSINPIDTQPPSNPASGYTTPRNPASTHSHKPSQPVNSSSKGINDGAVAAFAKDSALSFDNNGCTRPIHLVIRFRPLFATETPAPFTFLSSNCLQIHSAASPPTQFSYFQHIYQSIITQQQFYSSFFKPYLHELFNGYSHTILSLGATQTGKSYGLFGQNYETSPINFNARRVSRPEIFDVSSDVYQCRGLIPRVLEDIFTFIAAQSAGNSGNSAPLRCIISLQFYDISCNNVRDLFGDNSSSAAPVLQFDTVSGAKLVGISSKIVNNLDEALFLLAQAQAHRKNLISPNSGAIFSRSSAVFSVNIKRFSYNQCYSASLRVVDTVGADQLVNNVLSKEKQLENVQINHSISVLQQLLLEISSKQQGRTHYNDKLAQILLNQLDPALSNSQIHLFLTASSALSNLDATINTLKLGNIAQNLQYTCKSNKSVISEQDKQYLAANYAIINREIASPPREPQENQFQLTSGHSVYSLQPYSQSNLTNVSQKQPHSSSFAPSLSVEQLGITQSSDNSSSNSTAMSQTISRLQKELETQQNRSESTIKQLKHRVIGLETTSKQPKPAEKPPKPSNLANSSKLSGYKSTEIILEAGKSALDCMESELEHNYLQIIKLQDENYALKGELGAKFASELALQQAVRELQQNLAQIKAELSQNQQKLDQFALQNGVYRDSIASLQQNSAEEAKFHAKQREEVIEEFQTQQNKWKITKNGIETEFSKQIEALNEQISQQNRENQLEKERILQENHESRLKLHEEWENSLKNSRISAENEFLAYKTALSQQNSAQIELIKQERALEIATLHREITKLLSDSAEFKENHENQLKSWQKAVETMRTEQNEAVQTEKTAQNSEKQRLSSEISALQHQISGLQGQVTSSEVEINRISSLYEEKCSLYEELIAARRDLDEEQDAVVGYARLQCETLYNEEKARWEQATIQLKLEQHKEKSDFLAEIQRIRTENEQKLASQALSHAETLESIKKDHEEQQKSWETQQNSQEDRINQLEILLSDQNAQFSGELRVLSIAVERAESEKKQLEIDLTEEEATADAEMELVSAQLAQIKQELAQKTDKIEEIQQENVEKLATLQQNSAREVQIYEKIVAELREEQERAQELALEGGGEAVEPLKRAFHEISKLHNAREGERKARIALELDFEEKLAKFQQPRALENRISVLEQQNSELSGKIIEISAENSSLNAAKQELAQKSQELFLSKQAVAALRRESAEIAEKRQEINDLQEKLAQSEQKLADLSDIHGADLRKLKIQLATAESVVFAWEEKQSSLEKQQIAAKHYESQSNQAVAQLKLALDNINHEFQRERSINQRLVGQISTLKGENSAKIDELQRFEAAEQLKLRGEAKLRQKLARLEEENRRLIEKDRDRGRLRLQEYANQRKAEKLSRTFELDTISSNNKARSGSNSAKLANSSGNQGNLGYSDAVQSNLHIRITPQRLESPNFPQTLPREHHTNLTTADLDGEIPQNHPKSANFSLPSSSSLLSSSFPAPRHNSGRNSEVAGLAENLKELRELKLLAQLNLSSGPNSPILAAANSTPHHLAILTQSRTPSKV
jgi:hypothetical protein